MTHNNKCNDNNSFKTCIITCIKTCIKTCITRKKNMFNISGEFEKI